MFRCDLLASVGQSYCEVIKDKVHGVAMAQEYSHDGPEFPFDREISYSLVRTLI